MPLLIVAAFILSGATSLVLQVVWVRQLIDVFGSSSLAISTVLATFMGGLALGAWLGGALADRLRRQRRLDDPLFAYAACEALVGLAALAIPLIVGNYRGANAWLWSHLQDAPALLALARFVLAGAVLIIPTTCMGATLPLLGRRVTQSQSDLGALGRRIGVLYAANTAGAVLGAAGAGFYLIPMWGVRAANLGAALTALALAAAIAGLVLAMRRRPAVPVAEPAPADEPDLADASEAAAPARLDARERRLALIAFAISGAVAMCLEVLWSRTIALIVGSSVYSFTLVLVVFLVGIAAGAWMLSRRAARTARPLRLLGWLFCGVSASILLTHQVADDLPSIFIALLQSTELTAGSVMSLHTLLIGLLILPTSLCLGAVMPVVMRAYVGGLDAVGRDVGRAYAANTVGAIAGSFAGGFLILPLVGLEAGVRAAAAIDAGLAAALLLVAGRRRGAALAGALAIAAFVVPAWDRSHVTAGVFRFQVAKRYIEAGGVFDRPVVFYEDGIATTVSVEQGRGPILKNNGKVEASTVHDMPTQILVGLVPVLLHGGAQQDVFVVGYGSGITVGAIAQAPTVERIDVVELEPAVYTAADRFFGDYNNRPEADPRVHRFVGDGRNFLLAGDRRYDVIVSEPSNPWIAGVASLFTREFYAFALDHLSDDGVFCQWAQLYELGPRNVKTIYRTFAEAFPYVYAFTTAEHSSDTILLGSRRPLSFDLGALDRLAAIPSLRAELARAEVSRTEQLVANFILGPDEIAAFTAGASINTDDNALLEYTAPRDLLDEARKRVHMASLIFSENWPYGSLAELVSDWAGEPAVRRLSLARDLLATGRRREAARLAREARDAGADPADARRVELLVSITRRRTFDDPELPLATAEAPMPPPDAALFAPPDAEAARRLNEIYGLVAVGQWEDAWALADDLPPRAETDAGRDVSLLLGFLAYKSLRFGSARDLLGPLVDDAAARRRRPAALYYAGRAAYGRGKFRRGAALLDQLVAEHPELAATLAE